MIFLLQFEHNPELIKELIVVYKEGRKPIQLKTFYEVKGLIRWKSNSSSFVWRKDHGLITGNVAKLQIMFDQYEIFNDFRIMTKESYDYDKCFTEFEKPCPYYYGALSSLIMPTSLALLTFLFISCCFCCSCCLIQGMYTGLAKLEALNPNHLFFVDFKQSFGIPWKMFVVLALFQPMVPFIKFSSKLCTITIIQRDTT